MDDPSDSVDKPEGNEKTRYRDDTDPRVYEEASFEVRDKYSDKHQMSQRASASKHHCQSFDTFIHCGLLFIERYR
ncbi:MAG TPA: hypothetical protein VEC99_00510 [Clostridia bacterium]|nr:hypothetical protein [Clostridia bacterium]